MEEITETSGLDLLEVYLLFVVVWNELRFRIAVFCSFQHVQVVSRQSTSGNSNLREIGPELVVRRDYRTELR